MGSQAARAAVMVGVMGLLGSARGVAADTGNAWTDQARAARESGYATLTWIAGTSRRVTRLLMASRAGDDGPHARCASEGLSRVDVAYRHARADLSDALAAYDARDVSRARRALARLGTDREAARLAASDVDACFAFDRAAMDRTEVRMIIDPD